MDIVIPEGFKEVSKDEFFKLLELDKRDIMPSNDESLHYSVWMTPQRWVWGYTYPGWRYPRNKKAYIVRC